MPFRDAIVVLGDINVDVLGAVDRWPQPGDDCLAPHLEMHIGGVAANCALALSRWGIQPRLVGCVGQDEFGNFLRRTLRELGLDVQWVQSTTSVMTGLVYINVTPDGQRTFFGSRGANMIVRKPQRPHVLFHGAAALHLAGYNFLTPVIEATARYLHKSLRDRGAFLSLDVGPEPSRLIPRKLLHLASQVDILFANGAESYSLTRERDPRNALRSLLNAGAKDVVLKLGKDGCLIFDEGTVKQIPPFSVNVVDSTGAGDAFVAAFLQAHLRGWSQIEAAIAANAAGAAAVRTMGAGENLPHVREIIRVLENPLSNPEWDKVRRSVLGKVQSAKRLSR
ncbi:MAG TPA: carbohydrate kinase family protein [Candidatus Dormibacteraeota bacterium]|jgi:ribokinase|nr:carbohydrate kinase family protein [Candidatus Dormibacteraeota bacterium]